MKFTFSYDIENIKKCAEEVVLAVKKENISEVVCHSLSNNGGVLYQHFSQMAVSEPGLTIKVRTKIEIEFGQTELDISYSEFQKT